MHLHAFSQASEDGDRRLHSRRIILIGTHRGHTDRSRVPLLCGVECFHAASSRSHRTSSSLSHPCAKQAPAAFARRDAGHGARAPSAVTTWDCPTFSAVAITRLQHPNHVVATEHTASDGPQPAFVDGRLDQPNVIIKPREEQELNPYGRSSSLYMSVRPRSWCV
jgi:hypothetical protein